MKKRWIKSVLPLGFVIVSLGILADSDQSAASPDYFGHHVSSWFVGLGAGFERLFFHDRTNYLEMAPDAGSPADQFTLANTTTTNGMFSVFVGHQWRPVTNGRINLFLEFDEFTSYSQNGTRYAFGFSNPSSDVYSPSQYSFSLEHQALLFGAKVDVAEWHQLMPYVEAGVGVSRNSFSDFNNVINGSSGLTPVINGFPNDVNYDLAYIVGLGVDVLMQHNWLLSVGYRFGQWGDMQSGVVTNVPSPPGGTLNPTRLSNEMYSNQAMVRMSYSFKG